ncbi:MAG: hypothetical protein J6X40_03555 [Bacteroidales bacterium]|nr:hypothetical protein [Bacteroidales bacterium]
MKRKLFFFIAVTMLTACANPTQGSKSAPSGEEAKEQEKTVVAQEPEVDWTRPQYCLGMNNDTIARWVYDPNGALSQLYIMGDLYKGDFEGEDNTSDGSYFKFDQKGRLQAIVSAGENTSYRYEFKYGYEEEEGDDEEVWDSPYDEQDVELKYDDLDRVIYMSLRIRASIFAATLTYEGQQCLVDAVFSVPEMDELGIQIGTDLKETKYEYRIVY